MSCEEHYINKMDLTLPNNFSIAFIVASNFFLSFFQSNFTVDELPYIMSSL